VPEPKGELVVGVRPLFLRADKIVHSQQDTLKFRAFVQVLGVHDFFVPDSSSDEGGGSSSSYDGDDGYPGCDARRGLLCPWPQVYQLAADADEAGNPLSSLSRLGGRASWSFMASLRWLAGLSYLIFMPKLSTHHMHDPGSIVPYIRPKVITDNQMSRIKYNYHINNVSKDYDDSQQNRTVEDSKTPQERQPGQHVA
jgi:hypothetical protein